jgi:23S rRNA (cytidine1920-2'-O)/16S rRNA (cytidine1409-2'-O)-methyltransferase
MAKERLDKIVFDRGLAESRTRAQAMIMAGLVLVGDKRVDKPGQMVDSSADVRIKGDAIRYVSRGGLKLERALGEFGVNPEGKACIDIGASTGGFTDCLLQHGAAQVWAIDVGHNQLDWRMRQDPRVVVLEGQNARQLDPEQFPVRFDLATVDVIFISLTKILPALIPCLKENGECVALIKPQFEVGKGEVGRSGVVTDPKKHRRVLTEVIRSAAATGFVAVNLIESPILGAEGNREFLAHLKPAAGDSRKPHVIDERIIELTSG